MRILNLKNFLILITFLTIFYILTPYYGIYRFYIAVKSYDTKYLAKNIDWKILREGFKNDIQIIINEKIGKKDKLEKKILKTLLGNNLVEIILEEIVTPENIILLLNDPKKYKNVLDEKINNPKKDNEKINNEKNAKKGFKLEGPNVKRLREKINYFFFINPNTFRIDFIHDGYPIKVDLKFSFFKWKIHKIYLPVNLLLSKI